jgi:hypothetical protein
MAAGLTSPGEVTVAANPVAPAWVVVEPALGAVEEDERVDEVAGRPADPQAVSPNPRTTTMGSAVRVCLIHIPGSLIGA